MKGANAWEWGSLLATGIAVRLAHMWQWEQSTLGEVVVGDAAHYVGGVGDGGWYSPLYAALCAVAMQEEAGPVGTARDSGRDRRARLRASVVNRQTAILTCGGPRGRYCGRAVRSGDLLRGRDNAGRVDRFLGLVAPVGVDGIGWYGAVEGWVYGSAGRRDFTGRFPGVVRRSRGFDMGGARGGAESGVVVFSREQLWYWLR